MTHACAICLQNKCHFTAMQRCLKRPRRTYSKVTVSLLFLLWVGAFLYNNINIYFSLNWQARTFGLRSTSSEHAAKINSTSAVLITKVKHTVSHISLKDVKSTVTTAFNKKQRTLLAMPTHNRIGYVQLSLLALKQSLHSGSLHIFDDASTEYGFKELNEWAPESFLHFGGKEKIGPDANTKKIVQYFLDANAYDILIIFDSDMIVAPNWWHMYKTGLAAAPGLLSLYRSGAPKHFSNVCNGVVCLEPSMGNAGSVWRKDIASKFMHDMPDRIGGFDWGWSEWCTKNNISMHALQASAFLHVGMHGTWSRETTQEKSVGFPIEQLDPNIRQHAERFLKGERPTTFGDSPTNFFILKEARTGSKMLHEYLKHHPQIAIQWELGTPKSAYDHEIKNAMSCNRQSCGFDIWPNTELHVIQEIAHEYNAVVIVILRYDHFASAKSLMKFNKEYTLDAFYEKVQLFHASRLHLIHIIQSLRTPVFIVPYEHFLLHRESSLDALQEIVKLEHTHLQIEDTRSYWTFSQSQQRILEAYTKKMYPQYIPSNWTDEFLKIKMGAVDKGTHISNGAKYVPATLNMRPSTHWVIAASKREWTLELVLHSLEWVGVFLFDNVLISTETDLLSLNKVIRPYQKTDRLKVVLHPFSCARNPDSFPGNEPSLNTNYKGDTYGNLRSPTATCWKHHWWWLMNEAWKKNPDRVCFLEDDTIVHPQTRDWLLNREDDNIKLTDGPIAVPWCLTRKEWDKINVEKFCRHDDYNWDQTIAWMMERGQAGPNQATVPTPSLSMHIGDCDGWDSGGRRRNCENGEIEKIRKRAHEWMEQSFVVNAKIGKWLPAHTRPNGGWGHPRDHKHCLDVAGSKVKVEFRDTLTSPIHINSGKRKVDCDVPCYWPDHPGGILQTLRIDELDITLTRSMEGEIIYTALKLNNQNERHAVASTRFDSNIPMPYFDWSHGTIQTPHVHFSKLKKAAVFIARNCNSHSGRENLVQQLMKLMPVDSVSSCLNNIQISEMLKRNKQNIMKNYPLYFAFENQRVDDYITEKLWDTFKAGIIPVYLGAPNIKSHVPMNSIISVDDFKTVDDLANHLNRVLTDEALYDSYHAWRYQPLPAWFICKYNFTHVHSECRTCRWAYAKINNLPWNQGQQQIGPSKCDDVLQTSQFIPSVDKDIDGHKFTIFALDHIENNDDVVLIIEQKCMIDILFRDHTTSFGNLIISSTTLQWPASMIQWLVVHNCKPAKIKIEHKSNNVITTLNSTQIPVQSRYAFGNPQNILDGITICTQLTVDRLPRLEFLTARWAGPVSAAIYIGFRGSIETEYNLLKESWKNSVILQTYAVIHVIYAPTFPWFSTGTSSNGHGLIPYPVNMLRQIAVESAQTSWVFYVEADMATPINGHKLAFEMCCKEKPEHNKQAYIVPLYHGKHVPESKIALLNDLRSSTSSIQRERDIYSSHAQTDYDVLEHGKSSHFMPMIAGQEPYYIALKKNLPKYDVLFMSMLGDKVSQLDGMRHLGYTYKTSHNLFLVDLVSSGLGDGWIAKEKSWRQSFVHAMHPYTIRESHHGHVNILTTLEQKIAKDNFINQVEHIKTQDLFLNLPLSPSENKGPWKQGWDYDYDKRFEAGITIHVVPHSHNDPGWLKTFHGYYSTQTRHILDTIIDALTACPERTFIWAEISFFSLWWNDATLIQQTKARKLIKEGRFEFVTGGWVMNDEACVTARATRWQLTLGLDWLWDHFKIRPRYSWAIDPFGHSAGQAQILKEMNYKGMLIQRVHYGIKKQLAEKQALEFDWQTPAGDMFTHMMPFYSYDGPHTCGPDPSVCCQFDFARIGNKYGGCPWGKRAEPLSDKNIEQKSLMWLDQVYKKGMLYRSKHVLVPVGDDFRYQSNSEAQAQFDNYELMFAWIRKNRPEVDVKFSTLKTYFKAVRNENATVPKLSGSFFPYADRTADYWTGYFNSRIFYKGYDRKLESIIAAAEKFCPSNSQSTERRNAHKALALFQHHDGITGTAKPNVVQDYFQTMQTAVEGLETELKSCLAVSGVSVNPLSIDTPTHKAVQQKLIAETDNCQTVQPEDYKNFVALDDTVEFNSEHEITKINGFSVHEKIVWRYNQEHGSAGAYLMDVQSDIQKIFISTSHNYDNCDTYTQFKTSYEFGSRVVRIYKKDATIEITYHVNIQNFKSGELWATYTVPTFINPTLCSDVHGLSWECHTETPQPLQGNFWPMPTMAWLENNNTRMTWAGAQPTGVGLSKNTMIIMLDRKSSNDDHRGLGQGINDNVPVELKFAVLLEKGFGAIPSDKALSLSQWMQNPAIILQ